MILVSTTLKLYLDGYSPDSVFGWNDKSSFMINIASFESGEKQWTCCHAE